MISNRRMQNYQLVGYGEPLVRRETECPQPVGDEVLLRVEACGVCHSDIHLADGYFDLGDSKRLDLTQGRKLPFTLGHEISGVVEACGSDADQVRLGDRRVVYPWIGCRQCQTCSNGDEHLCGRPQALGVTRHGGFADYVVVPHSRYLFDIGDVSVARAGTYACSGLTAFSALNKVADQLDESSHLLVVGLGGVGLAALNLAPSITQTNLIGADVDDQRLQLASSYGAIPINPKDSESVKAVKRLTEGGVKVAIDFVGSEPSSAFALSSLASGGTLVVVGLFGGALKVSLPLLPLKRLNIQGSYVGSLSEMTSLMTRVRARKVPLTPLDERPISAAQSALDDLRAGSVVGRVVLRP